MKANGSKQTKQTEKESYIPGLYAKPMVQEIKAGISLSMAKMPEEDDPTIYDKEYYDRTYSVENGKYHQIRPGLHSCSLGIGAMDREATVMSDIPMKSSDAQRLAAMFFIPEIYPVKFMDMVYLKAPQPFRNKRKNNKKRKQCI